MELLHFMSPEEIQYSMAEDEEKDVTPLTEDEADDILAKILWARRKIEENNKDIKQKKEEMKVLLENYEKRKNQGLRNYIESQAGPLQAYAQNALKNKKGTLHLLHGDLRLKEDIGTTEFDDEEAVLRFIKEKGLEEKCVSVRESVRKTDFKKLFKKDPSGHYFVDDEGNVIHGVHIQKEDGLQLSIMPSRGA